MSLSFQSYLSPEDYLDDEETRAVRHEYIQGEIIAMAGSSDAHATIAGSLFTLIRGHVRGSGCRALSTKM